jgi:hypothetical protein
MALPTTRNTNYAAGSSAIKATDLNALQDCVIGKKFPSIVRTFFPRPVGSLPTNWSLVVGATDAYLLSAAAPTSFLIEIPTETGDRVTNLNFTAFGDGAVDCTFTVYTLDSAHVATNLCTFNDVNRAAAWGLAQLNPFTAHTMALGESLLCYVSANAANYRLSHGRLTLDRL